MKAILSWSGIRGWVEIVTDVYSLKLLKNGRPVETGPQVISFCEREHLLRESSTPKV